MQVDSVMDARGGSVFESRRRNTVLHGNFEETGVGFSLCTHL